MVSIVTFGHDISIGSEFRFEINLSLFLAIQASYVGAILF